MISFEQVQQFFDAVQGSRRILIGTHLNPDGDALGTALAMSHYLDAMGKENQVLCHNRAPENLRFLPGLDRVSQEPGGDGFDLGIVLDLDTLDRLGRTKPFFERCGKLILVDHHVPHEAAGDIRIVDVSAPATAVILTRLLRKGPVPITPDIATCLLCGIVTDTGSFRFRNTTPESLTLTAELIEAGGDIVKVGEEVYQRKPLASVLLLGRMLENMHLDSDNQLAWATLKECDFKETGAVEENTEGLVNEMLYIDTVQIAALIRQPNERKVRASIRSRGDFDVSLVARQFDGGGHRNAAGCTFETSIEEAEEALVAAMKLCLES